MKIGDIKYNYYFRQMILDAFSQGLRHPVEWICGFDRGIGLSHKSFDELNEFCDLAIKELYFWNCCSDGHKKSIDEVTTDECNNWIDRHYKK